MPALSAKEEAEQQRKIWNAFLNRELENIKDPNPKFLGQSAIQQFMEEWNVAEARKEAARYLLTHYPTARNYRFVLGKVGEWEEMPAIFLNASAIFPATDMPMLQRFWTIRSLTPKWTSCSWQLARTRLSTDDLLHILDHAPPDSDGEGAPLARKAAEEYLNERVQDPQDPRGLEIIIRRFPEIRIEAAALCVLDSEQGTPKKNLRGALLSIVRHMPAFSQAAARMLIQRKPMLLSRKSAQDRVDDLSATISRISRMTEKMSDTPDKDSLQRLAESAALSLLQEHLWKRRLWGKGFMRREIPLHILLFIMQHTRSKAARIAWKRHAKEIRLQEARLAKERDPEARREQEKKIRFNLGRVILHGQEYAIPAFTKLLKQKPSPREMETLVRRRPKLFEHPAIALGVLRCLSETEAGKETLSFVMRQVPSLLAMAEQERLREKTKEFGFQSQSVRETSSVRGIMSYLI